MKIIKLTAENVKRLRAVEITPDGTVQVITGRNAQGKTSVLDAIWLAALQAWKDTLAKREAAVAAHVAAPDVAAMEAELDSLEETNRAVRANADIAQRVARREALRAEYDALTARIDGLDKTKADALAQAQFPVDGLGFDEHGVTYQGVPFSQASSAADNLALISEMAAMH